MPSNVVVSECKFCDVGDGSRQAIFATKWDCLIATCNVSNKQTVDMAWQIQEKLIHRINDPEEGRLCLKELSEMVSLRSGPSF